MAFLDVHCFSDALGRSVSFYLLLPQPAERQIGMTGGEARARYPTLYLLHGLSDDHTIWMRRTAIERYAAAKNLAVVMPAAGRSFYQDMASGPKYWTFLSEELPALCRQWFPLSPAREDTFAAGLSMGGYGALRLGLERADRFAAAASLSGALDIAQRLRDAGGQGSHMQRHEWTGIFGSEVKGEAIPGDLFVLGQKIAAASGPKPALYLACGAQDELLADSRRFHQHLDTLRLANTYEESPGAHDWGYWDRQIQRVLDWLPLRR
ncbi:MAG: putative tributyrin esterase [Chthoniobacter sp.]|jgi:S-formylglutathione hydrolase FrmB|nr:putative tributyrin esterase [Chthoniobacter sp.]